MLSVVLKSECGIAQLSPYFSYFPAAAYVNLVELIYPNDLLDETTFPTSEILILSRSAGRSEIAMYGGRSHDLKISELDPKRRNNDSLFKIV